MFKKKILLKRALGIPYVNRIDFFCFLCVYKNVFAKKLVFVYMDENYNDCHHRTSTEREIKIRYRQLARTYHPDKYNSTMNKISKSEAQEHFKLLNNAYEFLRT